MKSFKQHEIDIIDPNTEMHYAILSSFQATDFPHSHDFYEFSLTLEGIQEITIGRHTLTLNPGTLILIRPDDLHSRRYIQPGLHINIAFSSVIARTMFQYLGSGYPVDRLLQSDLPPCLMLSPLEKENIQARMQEIYAVSLKDTSLQRMKLRVLIMDVFVHYFSRSVATPISSEKWFDHLIREMEKPENFSSGLPALLRISQKSHEYLCRVFREQLKSTPTEYINQLRLNYAANYLVHSDVPILDVCMSAGFDNLSYFYHLFRQKYQMTPKRFRTMHKLQENIFLTKHE